MRAVDDESGTPNSDRSEVGSQAAWAMVYSSGAGESLTTTKERMGSGTKSDGKSWTGQARQSGNMDGTATGDDGGGYGNDSERYKGEGSFIPPILRLHRLLRHPSETNSSPARWVS